MPLHIIIDGYNLIRQSRELAIIDRHDMQAGREALLQKLAAYRKVKPYAVTVVFDGSSQRTVYPRRDTYKGITVIYSSGSDTADDVIKDLAERYQSLLVVSSDNAITSYSAMYGANTIDSPSFEMRMEMAIAFGSEAGDVDNGQTAWDGTTRKKGPARREPKAKRRQKQVYKKL